jgi:hypothetical protein
MSVDRNTQTRIKIALSYERWSHEQSHARVRDTLRWLNKAKGRQDIRHMPVDYIE